MGYSQADVDISEGYAAGRRAAIEQCAKIAETYSNAKPGDICEVMAGDWQAGIAKAIRGLLTAGQ